MSRLIPKNNYINCTLLFLLSEPLKYLPTIKLREIHGFYHHNQVECRDFKYDKESIHKIENIQRTIMTGVSKEEYIKLSNTLGSIYRSL